MPRGFLASMEKFSRFGEGVKLGEESAMKMNSVGREGREGWMDGWMDG